MEGRKKAIFHYREMMKRLHSYLSSVSRLMTSWRGAVDLWQYLTIALNLCYLAMVTHIN